MELNYYVLVTSLRKITDRGHFVNKNEHRPGEDYFDKDQLIDKFDYNNISYEQLYEDDYGIIKDNLLLVQVQDCLEERLLELVEKSIFKVLMKTGKPEFGN